MSAGNMIPLSIANAPARGIRIFDKCELGFDGSIFLRGSGEETNVDICPDDSMEKSRCPSVDAWSEQAGNTSNTKKKAQDQEKLNGDQSMLVQLVCDRCRCALR